MKKTIVVILLFLGLARIASAQRRDNPTVNETMRWMQTSLENGGGDYWIGHEVRSTRLEDFSGCGVHFSASTHQEPFANGEPAPDKKPTHIDYFFSLGDIDPTTITFLKGLRLDAPSLMTIKTRNDEKKITTRFSWQSEVKAKPDDTYLIFTLDSIDADYVDRFTKAYKYAVEACGGKPSFFAESIKVDSDGRASPAAGGVATQSAAWQIATLSSASHRRISTEKPFRSCSIRHWPANPDTCTVYALGSHVCSSENGSWRGQCKEQNILRPNVDLYSRYASKTVLRLRTRIV